MLCNDLITEVVNNMSCALLCATSFSAALIKFVTEFPTSESLAIDDVTNWADHENANEIWTFRLFVRSPVATEILFNVWLEQITN